MNLQMAYQAKRRNINKFAIDLADTVSLAEKVSVYSGSNDESMLIAMTVACRFIMFYRNVYIFVLLPMVEGIENAFKIRRKFDYYKWKTSDGFDYYRITDSQTAMIDGDTNSVIHFIIRDSDFHTARLEKDQKMDAYFINVFENKREEYFHHDINSAYGRLNIVIDESANSDRSEKACDFVTRVTEPLN